MCLENSCSCCNCKGIIWPFLICIIGLYQLISLQWEFFRKQILKCGVWAQRTQNGCGITEVTTPGVSMETRRVYIYGYGLWTGQSPFNLIYPLIKSKLDRHDFTGDILLILSEPYFFKNKSVLEMTVMCCVLE